MTESQDPKIIWFNFLKAFTRALVQINLYKPDHPQVKQALVEGEAMLEKIYELENGDFSLTLEQDKLLANSTLLLTADKLPNSLKNLFSKFRIQTITFRKGAGAADLLALCQMQAHKGDGKEFLKERGIENITINEAVYAKVDPSASQPHLALPPEQPAEPAAPAEKVADRISGQELEAALATVVNRVTANAEEQQSIMQILSRKFKEQLETEVNRALDGVRREKKKIENDMVRTESVMTSMADGVVVVDRNGNILMMNEQAEAISGHPLAELSGKKIFDLPQIENQVVSLAKEIKSGDKEDISKDVQKLGTPGLVETVKKATAIIQNEDGKIVGSVSIPTDAAKFKQMEQLQQDFISNMTHELRSPLTSIKAALEIMSRETAGPAESSRNILNTAIRNTERLNSIITDILDFSKLQSGKLVFHPESTPPDEIAREAADAMKAWTDSKGLTLTVANEPDLPAIYADKRRTVQVLINLISNAIKFTPQGGSIEVSADSGREALSNLVFFSVKDNGCGISKDEHEKIFEKFVQVASGEKVGGTGLGLAITKAMVVLQGGRITVESDTGRGATFRVGMPVYKGQGDQPVFEPTPEAKELAKPWWKKILNLP